jgi:hypothetical protein
MATIKAVSSKASIATAINYVEKAEKTEEKLVSGIGCTPESAANEMQATKELWQKTDGRQYKHFVQSFPPDEKIDPEQAHKIALELVKGTKAFEGHEVIVATHKDKEHIHSHVIVNSVNAENGYKLQWSKADLRDMKDRSDNLCRDNSLSICQKNENVATYSIGKYKAIERGVTDENYNCWTLNIANKVADVKNQATSKEDFIQKLKEQGIDTKWSDTRKHITFIDQDGNKARNTKLERDFKADFGKESLEREFQSNATRQRAEQQLRTIDTTTGIQDRGINTDNTDLAIAELKARETDRTITDAYKRRAEYQNPIGEDKPRIKKNKERQR